MVVQASGARRLAERDPARASEAFLAVETSGREALTEIRRLLGVLRRDDEELALAPQPSLRHVALAAAQGRGRRPAGRAGRRGRRARAADRHRPDRLPRRPGGARRRARARPRRPRARSGCATRADHVELEVADDGGAPDAAAARHPRARRPLGRPAARRRAPRRRPRRPRAAPARRRPHEPLDRARLRRLDRRAIDRADRRSSSWSSARSSCSCSGAGAEPGCRRCAIAGVAYASLAWRRSRPLVAGGVIFATCGSSPTSSLSDVEPLQTAARRGAGHRLRDGRVHRRARRRAPRRS